MLKEYEKSITQLNELEDDHSDDLMLLSHKCWVLHKLHFFESAEALNVYNKGLEKFENHQVITNNKNVLCMKNPDLNCTE